MWVGPFENFKPYHCIGSVKNVIMALTQTEAGVYEFINISSASFFWYENIYRFSCRYFSRAPLYAVIVYNTICLLAMLISLILPYAFHKSEYAYYKFALCPFRKRVHDYNVIMRIILSFAAVNVIYLLRITEYAVNLLYFYWLHLLLSHSINCSCFWGLVK